MSIKISNNIIKMNTAEDMAVVQEQLVELATNGFAFKVDNSGEETSYELDISYELHKIFDAYNYQQDLVDCESYAHAVEDKNGNAYMESLTGMKLIKPKKKFLKFATKVIEYHDYWLKKVKSVVRPAHTVEDVQELKGI
ncbi:MAG: hypothetical protein Unbinned834contig1000_7 [Prokaryotic dsDNA virus sp.]|nr:MAG: hypothetical protein Unbinned834contig1000_7 [Prokaryotic dsDNA virus sp.]|tara:strand:- start:20197 stop:20613 length:417 start_codon:yes stop_codon:yes gene_type:complete